MTFWTGLQAAEDYYERSIYTTFVRWIRLILINISLFLPSLYVAITTFHPKLIPTNLLISIAAAREGIPFPAVIEALMMEFLFEGLRKRAFGYQNPLDQQLVLWGTCYRASCCASRYYFRTFSYCCGDNRYCVICVPALQLRNSLPDVTLSYAVIGRNAWAIRYSNKYPCDFDSFN